MFPEAKGRGKYSLPRVQYVPIFHKEGLIIVNSNLGGAVYIENLFYHIG